MKPISHAFGKAEVKGNKLYFDKAGWKLVTRVAKREKKTPRHIVIEAIMRGMIVDSQKTPLRDKAILSAEKAIAYEIKKYKRGL